MTALPETMTAIGMAAPGGPEVLRPETRPVPKPGPGQILVAIDSTQVVSKTLGLMATAKDDFQDVATDAVLSRNDGYANAARAAAGSRPNAQQISYMAALRNATAGWTPEHRKTFFSWFPHARTWKGGNSFKGFIENIRKEALANFVPKEEFAALDALSNKVEASTSIPNYVAPKGPGKNWTVDADARQAFVEANLCPGHRMLLGRSCDADDLTEAVRAAYHRFLGSKPCSRASSSVRSGNACRPGTDNRLTLVAPRAQ